MACGRLDQSDIQWSIKNLHWPRKWYGNFCLVMMGDESKQVDFLNYPWHEVACHLKDQERLQALPINALVCNKILDNFLIRSIANWFRDNEVIFISEDLESVEDPFNAICYIEERTDTYSWFEHGSLSNKHECWNGLCYWNLHDVMGIEMGRTEVWREMRWESGYAK